LEQAKEFSVMVHEVPTSLFAVAIIAAPQERAGNKAEASLSFATPWGWKQTLPYVTTSSAATAI
jgi:hypothetical protein